MVISLKGRKALKKKGNKLDHLSEGDRIKAIYLVI